MSITPVSSHWKCRYNDMHQDYECNGTAYPITLLQLLHLVCYPSLRCSFRPLIMLRMDITARMRSFPAQRNIILAI